MGTHSDPFFCSTLANACRCSMQSWLACILIQSHFLSWFQIQIEHVHKIKSDDLFIFPTRPLRHKTNQSGKLAYKKKCLQSTFSILIALLSVYMVLAFEKRFQNQGQSEDKNKMAATLRSVHGGGSGLKDNPETPQRIILQLQHPFLKQEYPVRSNKWDTWKKKQKKSQPRGHSSLI